MGVFDDWASGTLSGVGAPVDGTNLDTLWAWQAAEGGIGHLNPLNTTEELLAGIDIDPDFNRVGVEIYPTIQDGVIATVATLLNGRYPTILSHLRNSVPRAQWGDACAELAIWGTGCGWLNADFGAAPGALEANMDQQTFNNLVAGSPLANILGTATSTYQAVLASQKAIIAAVQAIGVATGGLTPAQAQELQEAHDAATQAHAQLAAIEANLNAPKPPA